MEPLRADARYILLGKRCSFFNGSLDGALPPPNLRNKGTTVNSPVVRPNVGPNKNRCSGNMPDDLSTTYAEMIVQASLLPPGSKAKIGHFSCGMTLQGLVPRLFQDAVSQSTVFTWL